jgi:hypothetical protein
MRQIVMMVHKTVARQMAEQQLRDEQAAKDRMLAEQVAGTIAASLAPLYNHHTAY